MNYEDIYHDFPLRCADVWQKMRSHSAIKDRDVTFMLMTAAAGLVMPHEHLKIQAGQYSNNANHPAFPDSKCDYKKVLEIVQAALDAPMNKSELFENIEFDKWNFSEVKEIKEIRDLVEYTAHNGAAYAGKKARVIVNLLRNAIAHNSFCARKERSSEEISHLTFFCQIKEEKAIEECKEDGCKKCDKCKKAKKERVVVGYDVLSMQADDFGCFLDAWFSLLKKAKPSKSRHSAEMLVYATYASLNPITDEDAA